MASVSSNRTVVAGHAEAPATNALGATAGLSSSAALRDKPAVAPARRPKWRRRLILAVLAMSALAWAAPLVASRVAMFRDWAIVAATSKLHGTLRVGRVGLDWFSPVVLEDVTLVDDSGQTVLSCEKIESRKTLLGLATGRLRLGGFDVRRPRGRLVLREGGSNLEDVLAGVLAEPPTGPRRVSLWTHVTDGAAQVEDARTGRKWQIDRLDVLVDVPADAGSTRVKASGEVQSAPGRGRFDVALAIGPPSGGEATPDPTAPAQSDTSNTTDNQTEIVLKSAGLPLEMFEPVLRRFDPTLELAGRITTDLTCRWAPPGGKERFALRGSLGGEDVAASGSILGPDRLHTARLAVPCELTYDGRWIDVRRLAVECDYGRATIHGRAPLSGGSMADLVRAVAGAAVEASADVDIARVAAALPNTLRIRPGTRITGGRLQGSLVTRSEGTRQVTTGRLDISNLAAEDRGRAIVWEQPLHAVFEAHDDHASGATQGATAGVFSSAALPDKPAATPSDGRTDNRTGPVIDRLECEASFLRVQGSGTWHQAGATAQWDFGRLAAELGRFVDLSGIELAGHGDAKFDWQLGDDGVFGTYADATVADFKFVRPGQAPWQEPLLRVRANATGQIEGRQLRSVYSATATVEAGRDQLRAQLTKPVFQLGTASWPIVVRAQGDVVDWQTRLRPWLGDRAWNVTGVADVTATAGISAAAIDVSELKCVAQGLVVREWGCDIDEPNVEIVAQGRWDIAQRQGQLGKATLRSRSLNLDADGVQLSLPDGKPASIVGNATFRGDVGRLFDAAVRGRLATAKRLSGVASGRIRLDYADGVTRATLEADGENLALAEASQPAINAPTPNVVRTASARVWTEPRLRLAIAASIDAQADQLRLDQFDVASDSLAVRAAGSIGQLGGRRDVDLQGQIDYDWQRLGGLLAPYLGADARIAGRGPQKFSVRGPIGGPQVVADPISPRTQPGGAAPPAIAAWRKNLSGEAAIGWTTAHVYGLDLGAALVEARLAGGNLAMTPLTLAVGKGQLTLAPQLRLGTEPAVLVLPKGPIAKDLRLTPELCAAGLKYAHPLLAGAAQVEGTVSLDVEGGWIPIFDPQASSASGRLMIHNVDVSSGPVSSLLFPLLVAAPPQRVPVLPTVDFWVDRGRVYHRGAGIMVGKTSIRTSGSVGFDETLDLVAEMPIPERWLGRNVLGTALANQTIKVPIRGTLSKPTVDFKALDRMKADLLRDAAGNVIRDELLDRLIRPKK